MHGKKYLSGTLALLLMTGCAPSQSAQNPSASTSGSETPDSTVTPEPAVSQYDFSWMEHHEDVRLSDLQSDKTFAVMNGVKEFSYPNEFSITPVLAAGEWLYGYSTTADNKKSVVRMNIENGKAELLSTMDSNDSFQSISIRHMFGSTLLYEEYEMGAGHGVIYAHNVETGERTAVEEIKSGGSHAWFLDHDEDGVMMCVWKQEVGNYVIEYLNMTDMSLEIVESENSGYPIYVNGYWYYDRIDGTTFETSIIRYDRSTGTKTEMYKMTGNDHYISGIYSAGDKMIVKFRTPDSNTEVYLVDPEDGTGEFMFTTTSFENVTYRNGYITWMGERLDPERGRLQYHLYNMKEKVLYDYADGLIYLSDDHIAWIRYKKKDDDIEKGEVFTNENTEICAQQMK